MMEFGYLIYQKSSKGFHEIEHRSPDVSIKLRRLLIMIDGRKTLDDLTALVPESDLMPLIRELEHRHLIEQHSVTLADMVALSAMPGRR